jgi:hypothetical protein
MSTSAKPAPTYEGLPMKPTELMFAMGSKSGGFDPFPPDQYLCFKTSKDAKQKALAIVREHTLSQHRRAPFMVDKDGNPIGLAGFAKLAGLQESHASEVLTELERDGLIRRENRGGAGLRIYLCAEVTPMNDPPEPDEKDKGDINDFPCTEFLTTYQLNEFNKLTPELQTQANAKIMDFEEWADDVEAEVMAAARLKTNAKREQVYLEFGLPVRKLKPVPNKREKPRRCAVQIELFAESGQAEDADSVQGKQDSVQTDEKTLYRAPDDSVQSPRAGLSINTEEETENTLTSSSSSSIVDIKVPSSSSSSSEPEVPMMMMDINLSEMAEIAEAVAVHSNAGNDWVISHLISEPRAIAPDAEIVEIIEQIHANWDAASKKSNPLGYLVKCVAKAFSPLVLASRRARARAAPDDEQAYWDAFRRRTGLSATETPAKGGG